MLQCEIAPSRALVALRWAKANAMKSVMNLTPARRLSPGELALINTLIMNGHEAAGLAGGMGLKLPRPHDVCNQICADRGVSVIVTLVAQRCVACHGGQYFVASAYLVDVMDTTAAGAPFVMHWLRHQRWGGLCRSAPASLR